MSVNGSTAVNQPTNDGKVKKSRNRIPTSCSVCRRRKIKCDRAKPHCGSCVSLQMTDSCSYNQRPWEYLSAEKQLSNEVIRLKLRINNLERELHNHQIVTPPDSFSTGGSSNEAEDPLVDLGVRFDKLIIKQNRLVHYGTTSYLGLQANDPMLISIYRRYFAMHHERFMEQSQQKRSNNLQPPKDIIEEKKENMEDALCWSEKTNQNIAEGDPSGFTLEDMTNDVNDMLPNYEIVILLLEHFFETGYPLFPFIDEQIYKEELSFILNEGEDGKALLKCQNSSQLVVISLLLILLRISYLILPLEDYYMDQKRIKNRNTLKLCASDVNIPSSFITHAKFCIFNLPGSDSLMSKVTLMNIQVLLFLKVYKVFAPEDGDEGTESNIHMAIVIQMCRIQGLHRDPEMFKDVVSDERVRYLWRKVWYKLLLIDASISVLHGAPLIVNDDQWDCSLPSLNKSDKAYLVSFSEPSSRDKNLAFDPVRYNKLVTEHHIIEGYKIEYKTTCVLRDVVHLTHNMKSTPRISDFLKVIKRIEDTINFSMESFQDLMSDPENEEINHQVLNIQKFRAKCSLILVRYILSYILLLASEDEEDISNNFNNLYSDDNEHLVKTTETALQLFKIAYDFLVFETEDELSCSDPNNHAMIKKFYGCYDKLIASDILIAAQRSFQFISSITMRYGTNFFSFTSMIRNFSNSQDAVDVLNWFKIPVHSLTSNVDLSLDKRFNIMLYQYLKIFYTKCLLLKERIFHCLRLNMLIKLFLSHLKNHYPETFAELNSNYAFDKEAKVDNLSNLVLAQLENLKLFNFDEDELMRDFINETEEDLLLQFMSDQRFSTGNLGEDSPFVNMPVDPKIDMSDNMFASPYGVNVLSPINQLNDLLSFNKVNESENSS